MKALLLLGFLLTSALSYAQTELDQACDFAALPTTRTETREYHGRRDRELRKCTRDGFQCRIVDRDCGMLRSCYDIIMGERQVRLNARETRTQLCDAAQLCKRLSVLSTRQDVLGNLERVELIDREYRCGL